MLILLIIKLYRGRISMSETNPKNKKIITYAITGANGFLGSYLSQYLENKKYRVLRLSRSSEIDSKFKYHLNKNLDEKIIEMSDILIHCAFNRKDTNVDSKNENLNAVKTLIEQIKKIKSTVKFINISSTSAYENAKSAYGMIKYQIEKEVNLNNGINIRPGIIYGHNSNQGSFNQIAKLVKVLPIIPYFSSIKNPTYTTHIDDLCSVIEKISQSELSDTYYAAAEKRIYFKEIIQSIVTERKLRRLLLPIHWKLALYKFFILEKLQIKFGSFTSDSIISLANENENAKDKINNKYQNDFRNL